MAAGMINWQFLWYHSVKRFSTNEAGCHFCGAHLTRESWNRRNTIYNIFHQNTALRLLFCVVVYLYEFQMSIVKHFSMDSVKFELGIKRALYFNDFLWKVNILKLMKHVGMNTLLRFLIWNICKQSNLHLKSSPYH